MEQRKKPDINLTTEIQIAALTLAVTGFVHGWFFYSQFDINIFDFLNISDFATLSFRNPNIILWSSVISVVMYFLLGHSRAMQLASIPFVFCCFSIFISIGEANRVKAGEGRDFYKAECSLKRTQQGSNTISKRVTPLGTAGDYLVFYELDKQLVHFVDRRKIESVTCSKL